MGSGFSGTGWYRLNFCIRAWQVYEPTHPAFCSSFSLDLIIARNIGSSKVGLDGHYVIENERKGVNNVGKDA